MVLNFLFTLNLNLNRLYDKFNLSNIVLSLHCFLEQFEYGTLWVVTCETCYIFIRYFTKLTKATYDFCHDHILCFMTHIYFILMKSILAAHIPSRIIRLRRRLDICHCLLFTDKMYIITKYMNSLCINYWDNYCKTKYFLPTFFSIIASRNGNQIDRSANPIITFNL